MEPNSKPIQKSSRVYYLTVATKYYDLIDVLAKEKGLQKTTWRVLRKELGISENISGWSTTDKELMFHFRDIVNRNTPPKEIRYFVFNGKRIEDCFMDFKSKIADRYEIKMLKHQQKTP